MRTTMSARERCTYWLLLVLLGALILIALTQTGCAVSRAVPSAPPQPTAMNATKPPADGCGILVTDPNHLIQTNSDPVTLALVPEEVDGTVPGLSVEEAQRIASAAWIRVTPIPGESNQFAICDIAP